MQRSLRPPVSFTSKNLIVLWHIGQSGVADWDMIRAFDQAGAQYSQSPVDAMMEGGDREHVRHPNYWSIQTTSESIN